jgi:hypothetical protein
MFYHANDLKEKVKGCANVCFFFLKVICPFFLTSIISSKNSIVHLVHWCGVEIQFGLLAFCGCAMGGTFHCWSRLEQSILSPMRYIQYHDWMLHLGLIFQLVGGDYSKPIQATQFNLLYTSQKFKKLVKFGYVKSA